MKVPGLDNAQRKAAPIEDHLAEVGLLVKRADLMRPVPMPDGQGPTWPGALTLWITTEVVLTFEQADRATYKALRDLPWVMTQDRAEAVAGVLEGLRLCLGPRALLIVPGDARVWWLEQGRERFVNAVLWSVGS